jgi:hypothetical protein
MENHFLLSAHAQGLKRGKANDPFNNKSLDESETTEGCIEHPPINV